MSIIKDIYHRIYIEQCHFRLNRYYKKKKRNNSKMRVVFLVQRTEVWNSVATIYEAAKKDQNIETFIVALPKYRKGKFELDNTAVFDFCKKIDNDAINSYDKNNNGFFKIQELNPDYIFLNVPYNHEMPKEYKFEELSKYAKLCYVPYAYAPEYFSHISFNPILLKCCSFLFAENNQTYSYCKKNSTFLKKGNDYVFNIGYSRFDLFKDVVNKNEAKTILWLPRWTEKEQDMNEKNEASHFFDYQNELLEYMKNNKNLLLIIRPHPLAFDHYIEEGLWDEKERNEYINRVNSMSNVVLDEESNYMNSLLKADILVSDYSSLIMEYFVQNKPIIYSGSKSLFENDEMKKVLETMYCVSEWEELKNSLDSIISGIDEKASFRRNNINSFLNGNEYNVGEKIVNIIQKDFELWKEGK